MPSKYASAPRLATPALLAALICALFAIAASSAQAQDRWLDLPAPTGVAAANGANPGAAVISWQPVAGAAFYRIAWIAAADADAIAESGGEWLGAIAYTNLAADAGTQHTLTRLNPGTRYMFLVGALRITGGTPSWSLPVALDLTPGTLAPDPSREITTPLGLTANEPGAFGGYTLFSARLNKTSYLIDSAGRMVQRWDYPFRHIRLLENGNVMGQDRNGIIYEVDPSGNLLWQYQHTPHRVHHDFLQLPNGNVLLLVHDNRTAEAARAAGANPAYLHPVRLTFDAIVEVRPIYPDGAEVVWEWYLWDHLVQDYDPAIPNFGVVARHPELVDLNYHLREMSRTEYRNNFRWSHVNALDYNPQLDQILMSSRNLEEIWIIDHSTTTEEAAGHSGGNSGRGGDLLYRWGNPQVYRAGSFANRQLFGQHHAQWIREGLPGAGNILIFNNGDGYEGRYLDHSAVVEITPPAAGYGYARVEGGGVRYGPAQPTWTYTAPNPTDFLSYRGSGMQRLPNGNTMIVSGMDGVVFEVTPDGATVWRYVNPVAESGPLYQGDPIPVELTHPAAGGSPHWSNNIYRAYRYAPDYPGLQYYDLTPQGTVERYRDAGP